MSDLPGLRPAPPAASIVAWAWDRPAVDEQPLAVDLGVDVALQAVAADEVPCPLVFQAASKALVFVILFVADAASQGGARSMGLERYRL